MEVQHCYWNFILIDISFLFSARAVRTHWGNLVRSGVVKRDYREVSINNVITLGTRVRIVIMRVSFAITDFLFHLFTSNNNLFLSVISTPDNILFYAGLPK